MSKKWVTFAPSLGFALLIPTIVGAQDPDLTTPTVNIVSSVGCATQDGATWTLTRASEPIVTGVPFSSTAEIEEAKSTPLGSSTYTLIGVADFLPVDGLLEQFQRAEFTATESVNSTGALVSGHQVLVKGLFIEDQENQRINLTSVIGLAESCG